VIQGNLLADSGDWVPMRRMAMELVFNSKPATVLGFTVPRSLLLLARVSAAIPDGANRHDHVQRIVLRTLTPTHPSSVAATKNMAEGSGTSAAGPSRNHRSSFGEGSPKAMSLPPG
jgi:hypothetical protein